MPWEELQCLVFSGHACGCGARFCVVTLQDPTRCPVRCCWCLGFAARRTGMRQPWRRQGMGSCHGMCSKGFVSSICRLRMTLLVRPSPCHLPLTRKRLRPWRFSSTISCSLVQHQSPLPPLPHHLLPLLRASNNNSSSGIIVVTRRSAGRSTLCVLLHVRTLRSRGPRSLLQGLQHSCFLLQGPFLSRGPPSISMRSQTPPFSASCCY